jgi:chaperonin GroES
MIKLSEITYATNVADKLEEEELAKIGAQVIEDFEMDCESRQEWFLKMQEHFEMALQLADNKQWPWPGASNVQFPLLTIASLQFHARAYPALVPQDGQVVKARTVGVPTQEKLDAAVRVSRHMSYQVMEEMQCWEEGMDRLLLALPIAGSMFKKTYYDTLNETNCSEIIYPKDLVVNYYAKSLDSASRISHCVYMYKNDIHERIASGIFRDVDIAYSDSGYDVYDGQYDSIARLQGLYEPSTDEDAPYLLIEQHRWLDLDEDGYKEPYCVTVDYCSKKVLRIYPRFDAGDIDYNTDNELIRIKPKQYFTKFSFIPNPDGGFYDLGFGVLLGPINHTVNTLINQLIDAGTLSNLQAGFIGRGVRIKGGDTTFKPGEWKTVQTTGDDLRKNIVPMPVREPSSVLFQLLGQLINAGRELSSVSETMVGKMPGQNTPATTTQTAVEQGLKVFSAIYKRIYRSLGEEFKKLFDLNKEYLAPFAEFTDLGDQQGGMVSSDDYQNNQIKIIPGADASVGSEQMRAAKAQSLLQMLPLLPNKMEVVKRVLLAQDQQDIEMLLQAPQPQGPSPEEMQMQIEQQRLQIEQFKAQSQDKLNTANAQLAQTKGAVEVMKTQLHAQEMGYNTAKDAHQAMHDQQMDIAGHQQQQGQIDNDTAQKFLEAYLKHEQEMAKAQASAQAAQQSQTQ